MALESLQPDLSNLRLVQEASAGNNQDWLEAASSIVEQSEADTAAARMLSWREGVT